MKKEKLVVQDNKLIGLNKGLKLNTAKLLKFIICKVQNNGENLQDLYKFRPRDFLESIGVSNNTEKTIKEFFEHLDTLQTTQFEIKEGTKIIKFVWITYYEYSTEYEGSAAKYIKVRINPDLQPYLQMLTQYTKYAYDTIARFRNRYTINFFEIITRDIMNRDKQSYEFKYEDFRDMIGIYPNTYARYNSFRERVINPIINDLENAGYKVNFKSVKVGEDGKMVKYLKFDIKRPKNK